MKFIRRYIWVFFKVFIMITIRISYDLWILGTKYVKEKNNAV